MKQKMETQILQSSLLPKAFQYSLRTSLKCSNQCIAALLIIILQCANMVLQRIIDTEQNWSAMLVMACLDEEVIDILKLLKDIFDVLR